MPANQKQLQPEIFRLHAKKLQRSQSPFQRVAGLVAVAFRMTTSNHGRKAIQDTPCLGSPYKVGEVLDPITIGCHSSTPGGVGLAGEHTACASCPCIPYAADVRIKNSTGRGQLSSIEKPDSATGPNRTFFRSNRDASELARIVPARCTSTPRPLASM